MMRNNLFSYLTLACVIAFWTLSRDRRLAEFDLKLYSTLRYGFKVTLQAISGEWMDWCLEFIEYFVVLLWSVDVFGSN